MAPRKRQNKRRGRRAKQNSLVCYADIERAPQSQYDGTSKIFVLPSGTSFVVQDVVVQAAVDSQPLTYQFEIYAANGYVVKIFPPVLVPMGQKITRTFRWPRGAAHVYGKANESDALFKLRVLEGHNSNSRISFLIACHFYLGTPEISLFKVPHDAEEGYLVRPGNAGSSIGDMEVISPSVSRGGDT